MANYDCNEYVVFVVILICPKIPEARSLDVFLDQICVLSLATTSQEIHYAGVVCIADFPES